MLRVTERVQDNFSKWFELWGHKQAFAGDPLSFCGSLENVLGGFKGRPKNSGPYTLLICYKHKGHVFYKVYSYNEKDHLIFPQDELTEKTLALLQSNRDNLSFVGERIKMDKDVFIKRFKKLPLLTEFMRMNISQRAGLIKKTVTEFIVEYVYQDQRMGTIQFVPDIVKKPMETPGPTPSGAEEPQDFSSKTGATYKFIGEQFIIELPAAFKEDVLSEIKGRIFEAIRNMTEYMLHTDPKKVIPPALDPNKYLNHSLQFFSDMPLEDTMRIGTIVK